MRGIGFFRGLKLVTSSASILSKVLSDSDFFVSSSFGFQTPTSEVIAAMSEYTSTREGFQRAMKWSLTGAPEDTKLYVEATVMPNFYQVMNGQHLTGDTYTKGIEEWRAKISDYEPVV